MTLPIETERLRLRRYLDQDLTDILEYSSDADFWLARNLDWPGTAEGVKEYWEAQRAVDPDTDPKWLNLVVELKATGKAIGSIGISFVRTGEHRQGCIGWLLGRKYQGQGLATEAVQALVSVCFDELGFHRVSARTGADNQRSWRLMERVGMRQEAHFRESHLVKDEWRDEFVYAVLADEWRAAHSRAATTGDSP
jgi:RimJ/RimL family protein N-acetyltransferase